MWIEMGDRVKTLGVVGAGVMGAGLAERAANAGIAVVLIDLTDDLLSSCRQRIATSVRFSKMFAKAKAGPEVDDGDDLVARIRFSTDYAALADCDFIVENASEKWDVKQSAYQMLARHASEETVIAANTSCFSITRLGALIPQPERLLGIHFMNPVPMKDTAEMVRGYWTSEATIARAESFLGQLGKTGIIVNDSPGFVSNRVLMLTINEAIMVLQDGVSDAAGIDNIFKKCFEHKMGPLETADLIGLDTILYSIEVLHESFGDSKYRPAPLLKKMVDAGLLGRKTNEGFYKYGRKKT